MDLEKKQKISANLEKVSMAKDKREFQQVKATAQIKEKIESKLCQAEENREKYLDDVKEKVGFNKFHMNSLAIIFPGIRAHIQN